MVRRAVSTRQLAMFVAGSLLVHGALASAATTFGHGSQASGRPQEETIDLELTAEQEPEVPNEEKPPLPMALARAAAPEHQHPYPVAPSHEAATHDPRLAHPHQEPTSAPAPEDTRPTGEEPTAPPRLPVFALAANAAAPGSASRASTAGDGAEHVHTAPVSESQVSAPARALVRAAVAYPPAARAAEIEADVLLEIVVGPNGRVTDARVIRPAGYGFDAAALAAIRNYAFSPALRDGTAVAVRMRWTVDFRLR